jgi:hypothetical protein
MASPATYSHDDVRKTFSFPLAGLRYRRATPMTCSWRSFSLRFRLNLLLLALLSFAFVMSEVTAALALEGRLRVVPVLFIPSDNSEIYEGGKIAAYKDLVRKYLALAQSYYRTELVTDTFAVCRQSISDSWLGNLRECLAHLV